MRSWMKEKREELGLTQQNVADSIGISKQYYQLIEKGQRQKKLNTLIIMNLATCFGISAIDIVNFETK